MKKLYLSLALLAVGSLAYGQGTVQFSNGTLTKISTQYKGSSATPVVTATTSGLYNYGLFFGLGQSTSLTLLTGTIGVNSTTGAGYIASSADGKTLVTTLAIPGSTVGETDVYAQVAAWSATYGADLAGYNASVAAWNADVPGAAYGVSTLRNINGLNATAGPGVAIWQGATGTNAKLINAFVISVVPVPEPATFALAGLGAAAMLIFRRRK
jgi:hypothetical protein